MSVLKEKYTKEILSQLCKEFSYKNVMQAPGLEKISVNMGLGEAVANPRVLELAGEELKKITGQKARVNRARQSIAAFKLREGMPIGLSVTLRGKVMWAFLERLFLVALPRVRDFRGVSRRAFDGNGNYTLGVREQIIFPEISYDEIDRVRGMNITLKTSAESDDEGRRLLELLGMPFRKN